MSNFPIQIHHAKSPRAMVWPEPQDWYRKREEHYRHVATVVAPLEKLFALTNHTNHRDWLSHEAVAWWDGLPARSTAVGDVFYCSSTGQAWMVMPYGFQELPR